MPAAIQRFFISPSFQRLTGPVVVRQIEIIDSVQFVFVKDCRNRPVTPSRATVLAIPAKRMDRQLVSFLTDDEVNALTRWINAACSGWRSAAWANSEWMAARRLLRVRTLLRRSTSRWSGMTDPNVLA